VIGREETRLEPLNYSSGETIRPAYASEGSPPRPIPVGPEEPLRTGPSDSMRARLSINLPSDSGPAIAKHAASPTRPEYAERRRFGTPFRVFMGRLIRQWRLTVVAGAFGALIAAAWCSWTPIIWTGRLEVAVRAVEGDDRPDPITLRATLLDPNNLAALLPGSPTNPDPSIESWMLGVERGLRIEPADRSGTPTVWRVHVEIPSPVRPQAQSQFDEYLKRVRGRIDPAYLADRPAPIDGSPLIAAGGFGDDGLSHRDRLARYREIETEIDGMDRKAAALAEDVAKLAPLLKDGAERVALSTLESFPTLREIAEQIARLERDRRAKTRTLKEAHPNVKELDRRREVLLARFQDLVREQQAELKQKREELDRNLTGKRRELVDLAATLGSLAPPRRTASDRPAPPKSVPSSGGPASLPVGLRSDTRSAGGLVVAGPIVEASPSQPAYVRTVLAGLALGLAFGIALGIVKSVADQRVFDPEEIQDLGIELTLLGTIPQRSGPVVTVGEPL
jgi:hypothetical protein